MAIENQEFREKTIQEILSEPNKERKENSKREYEIFRKRQEPFVLERLRQEFSAETVRTMRRMTSLAVATKVVKEKASIYKNEPTRDFGDLTELQQQQIDNLYKLSNANVKLKMANRMYVLHDQCAAYIVPDRTKGVIDLRILQPHEYDVIPSLTNPEKAEGYVLNVLDSNQLRQDMRSNQILVPNPTGGKQRKGIFGDQVNQNIADEDDDELLNEFFIFWDDTFNFMTTRDGLIVDPETFRPLKDPNLLEFLNPIEKLPFVDIAGMKDNEFLVRPSSTITQFSLEFNVAFSDLMETMRLQNYSQPVIASKDQPRNLIIGPQNVIWLQLEEGDTVQPTFGFESPSPDLSNSLEVLKAAIATFLSTEGLSSDSIQVQGAQTFGSAMERLIAAIEKFEASQDDIDVFRQTERKVFEIKKRWSNLLQDTDVLIDDLKLATIPEETKLNVRFAEPSVMETMEQKEARVERKLRLGLMSRKRALLEIDPEMTEEQAEELIRERDEEQFGQIRTESTNEN